MKRAFSFDSTTIYVDQHVWSVPYPVRDARRVGDLVVVLYDYMAGPKHHQFQNLEGFDPTGRKLWTAHHPTNETADAYVEIRIVDAVITAWSSAGFECEIDSLTGRLVCSKFTK